MKISEIKIFPIKSLGGISVQSSVVERRGLQFDRRWMLVNRDGIFFTQREFPKLSTVSVALAENGVNVCATGFESIYIPYGIDGKKIRVQVWGSECDAIPNSAVINEWFSEFLKFECKLVFMPDESEREVNPRFNKGNEIVSFADGYPIMVIGENSLNELNCRLETKLPMNRFRPNLVVFGSGAFAEDGWKKIRIGETVFRITKPCERCVVTTVEQERGEFAGKEPLKTLANFRSAKDVYPDSFEDFGLSATSVLFGQNLIPEGFGGLLSVNDELVKL
jgi:uncharacterized protein YcbX